MAKKKQPAKRTKKSKKTKKNTLLWRGIRWMLALAIWGGLALTVVLLWYAKDLPDITQSAVFERRASIIIKSADNITLARYGESKGETIKSTDLPQHLIDAVLATEDRRFYDHSGIDPWGITRAMIINLYKGRFVQGGSTITQQLAKNLFLSHKRTIDRKIQEALLALWLERQLTKDEILSAYMNRVYLGSGTYGFEAAAQLYFGKSAKQVNLLESATLAGLLKAPSKYSPHQNPQRAKERANVVLNAMNDAGYITREQQKDQENQTLTLPHKKAGSEQNVRYFTDWVMNGLDSMIGISDTDIIIETTLDSALQSKAQFRLTTAINRADEMQFVSQGGILTLRPDGAIVAMVGGHNYTESQFNRTTQARRPPGSAFKPFVFLTALEKGWKPSSKILDSPITSGEYRPKNFAENYLGTVDLETALAKSLNTATVRLAEEIGMGPIIKTAKKLGIISPLQRDLSLSLGSSGVSMLELGTAYAVFANGGHKILPYAITRVTTQDGDILFEREEPQYTRIIKSNHARNISFMLQSVVNNGTGKAAKLPFPTYGKTGTSQDSRDAWFAGYTDKLVTIVWLGNDDNSPMRRVTGGGLPAHIWHDIMKYGHPRQNETNFPDIKNNTGFANLLKKLTEGGNARNTQRKHDFSNLND